MIVRTAVAAALVAGAGILTGAPVTARQAAVSYHCSVSTTALNFGVYRVFDTQAVDSTAEVRVSCKHSVRVGVSLNAGLFGTYLDRRMQSTRIMTDRLRYQVYVDPGRQGIWGSGVSGTTRPSVVVGPSTTVLTLYGRIFPLQMVGSGDYVDGLLLTLTF